MSVPAALGAGRRTQILRLHPEAARAWIAYAPRRWPAADGPWTDLASACIRALRPPMRDAVFLPDFATQGVDDLLYFPPVAATLAAARDRRAAGLTEAGIPVLLQLQPGDEARVAGAHVVYDLLRPLLAGEIGRLSQLPAAAVAVWPLLPGLSDGRELWERGCVALAEAGARCVQPLALELGPGDRRALAEAGGDDTFDALFHATPPSERDFARCAAGHGLEVFPRRPGGGFAGRHVRNRLLAADLALAGELWLRLGRSVSGGQGLLQSARGADRAPQDLVALAREGNLGVLDWLDATSVEMVAELAEHGRSALLTALLDEYLGGAENP